MPDERNEEEVEMGPGEGEREERQILEDGEEEGRLDAVK